MVICPRCNGESAGACMLCDMRHRVPEHVAIAYAALGYGHRAGEWRYVSGAKLVEDIKEIREKEPSAWSVTAG